jgi:hypothetical protein
MDPRRARRQGLIQIEDRRQLFNLHDDQLGRRVGSLEVHRGHRGHRLSNDRTLSIAITGRSLTAWP